MKPTKNKLFLPPSGCRTIGLIHLDELVSLLGGGNSNMFYVHPCLFVEDEAILTSIFFKGVGSTTNQFILIPSIC